MVIEQLWDSLARHGITVPETVQRQIGMEHAQERVMIRPPAASNKAQVLAIGTTVPATFVARKLGITVRQVRKYRALLR